MPDSSLTLEMLIKEGRAVIGLNRVAEAETKVERAAAGITKEAKRAEAELDRFAKRTTAINATPLERYNAQMSRLEAALERGKLKHEVYTRAVNRARLELDAAGRVQQDWLSNRFIGQLGAMTAGYLTLGNAVRVVGDAFRHGRQQGEQAQGTLVGLDESRRKLAQLATSMPAGSLAAMQERADKSASASGASRATAYEVLFQAHSYGFEKQYEQVMGMNPIIDASAAASIAGKVRLMTGSKKSPSELVAGLIEAGKPSEVDAETLSGPMAIALEGGSRLGANAEETMALLSAMTKYYAGRGETQGDGKTGAARVAGDRIRAFAHKVATRLPELKDKGLIAGFEAVRGMSEEERADFLKENEEVSSAYERYVDARNDVAVIHQRVLKAEADEAAGRGNVSLGIALRAADPKSRAAIALNRAQIAEEVAKETSLGIATAERTTKVAQGTTAAYETGQTTTTRYGGHLGGEYAKTIGAEGQAPVGYQAIGQLTAQQFNGQAAAGSNNIWFWLADVMTKQLTEARLQTEILSNINQNAGTGGGTATRAIAREAAAPLN